jgi:hypothetical protein
VDPDEVGQLPDEGIVSEKRRSQIICRSAHPTDPAVLRPIRDQSRALSLRRRQSRTEAR